MIRPNRRLSAVYALGVLAMLIKAISAWVNQTLFTAEKASLHAKQAAEGRAPSRARRAAALRLFLPGRAQRALGVPSHTAGRAQADEEPCVGQKAHIILNTTSDIIAGSTSPAALSSG